MGNKTRAQLEFSIGDVVQGIIKNSMVGKVSGFHDAGYVNVDYPNGQSFHHHPTLLKKITADKEGEKV